MGAKDIRDAKDAEDAGDIEEGCPDGEHIVNMPPVSTSRVEARIVSVEKAEPTVVVDRIERDEYEDI